VNEAMDYQQAVENARRLLAESQSASWELARICHEVTEAGIPARTFAEDVGISRTYVEKLVRTWDRYAYRMHEKRSFAEFFILANTTRERAERLEAVAQREGISVSTARNLKLAPSDKEKQRPDLLKDLVSVRQRLLVSVDRAKVAAQYADVSTLQSVAEEIRDAARELLRALSGSVSKESA
jgi:hypothetical protein